MSLYEPFHFIHLQPFTKPYQTIKAKLVKNMENLLNRMTDLDYRMVAEEDTAYLI